MQSISEWLQSLGLEHYEQAFIDNDIDLALIAELSEQDLEKIGVSSLGHRKKLLKAIAQLGEASVKPSSPVAQRPSTESGERRQLTVLFCDMVGFTELASRLDPEDLQKIVRSYEDTCAAAITRYEGYVFQRLGDGIVAFFGYPLAHEGEAERAIRAGLDIIDALSGLEVPEVDQLSVRIGIATGVVVVSTAEKGAVGETMNLAARLQGIAAPGAIVVSERVRRLAGGAFDYHDLGEQTLKGIAQPTHAYWVLGVSQAGSRFEAASGEAPTPLVGREHELSMLLGRWQQAQDGEGQVVLLSGEPGIGKSRVVQALREQLDGERHSELHYQCSPFYTNSALYPFITWLERTAGFVAGDTANRKLDKLETALAAIGDKPASVAPLFASLLSLPQDCYPSLNLSPQRQKEKTIEALADQIVYLSRSQSVLMVFEDAHWADMTTLEALGAVISRTENAPVLLVVTHRPEFEPPWSAHGHIAVQALTRLSRRSGAKMVDRVTSGKSLPQEVVEQIVAKTDGVPLFVEELTKTILQAGCLRDAGDQYELDGRLPAVAIPSTLQGSLMARLDRLGAVKEIAQIGACIGREFSYQLIQAVSPIHGGELQDALQRLVDSGLIFQRGAFPDAMFTFKHALVQDAAYESLLKRRRQQIHATIAEALAQHFSDLIAAEPELAAHHYTEAGQHEQAVKDWLAAGQKALARSANAEASAHLNNGLDCLATLPENHERDKQELTLQTLLGFALMNFRGYGAPETAKAYTRASELCQVLGDSEHLGPILLGLWVYYIARSDFTAAGKTVALCFAVGEDEHDPAVTMLGHALGCGTRLYLGDAVSSLDHAEKGIALYDPEKRKDLARRFGLNVGPMCPDWGSMALWLLGYPDRAAVSNRKGLALAQATEHPLSYANVLSHAAVYDWLRRDAQAAYAHAQATIELSQEVDMPFRQIEGMITQGWTFAESGEAERGALMIRDGIKKWRAIEATRGMPLWLTMLAQAESHLGDTESALRLLEEAFAAIERTGERIWEAEMYRLKGVFLLSDGPRVDEAERCFEKAIYIAHSQTTKSWELRATTSLARLWGQQGKRKEAHDLIAPAYNWFTEGFDTRDLKEAKALLAGLSA